MNTHRIIAIVLRQFYLIRDNPTRFFQMFVWMTLDIVLWGFISKYVSQLAPSAALAAGFLGSVVLFDFLQRAMQGVTTAFFEDVWARNFLNFFASPLTKLEYLAGLVISSVLTTALVFAMLAAFAALVFGLPASFFGPQLLAFLVVLFLFGISLGVVGIAVVLRFGPAAEWFVWPMPAILAPFAGVIYPLSTLPEWMQAVGRLLPPSYVFEGVRSIVQNGSLATQELLVALALVAVYLAGAYAIFAHIYQRALRSGAIARYSAETAF